jgi:hypothetical protein
LHGGTGNGGEVAQRGVGQLAVQSGVDDHHARVGQHQRVAIGGGFHHLLRAHGAACAGLVVHHDGLAQHGLQLVGEQPRMLVQRAACGETNHHFDGFVGKRGLDQKGGA